MDWIDLAFEALAWFVRDWRRWLLLCAFLAVVAMVVVQAEFGS